VRDNVAPLNERSLAAPRVSGLVKAVEENQRPSPQGLIKPSEGSYTPVFHEEDEIACSRKSS
jgi:hypothetical protein